jgi:hypothetical protein
LRISATKLYAQIDVAGGPKRYTMNFGDCQLAQQVKRSGKLSGRAAAVAQIHPVIANLGHYSFSA